MKTKSIIIGCLAILTFSLTNCSGKKENTESQPAAEEHASGSDATPEASAPQFTVDAKFQEQLAGVFTAYVELKDAFVASDLNKVKAAASKTATALSNVDMKLLTGAAHNDWMNYHGNLETSLKEIESASDLSSQRTAFSNLSNNLYKGVKAFGLGGATAYYEYCPMAFDNQGAYWLSDQSQIKNPYFGDEMLTCGMVKETLK
jgi:hypothetical protein